MSDVYLLAPEDIEDEPVPHPELVLSMRPSASQVMATAGIIGLFADGSYLGGEVRISLPV